MAYPYGNSPLTTVTFFFDHSRHHSPLKLCKGTVRAILHHCFGAVLYSDRENDDEFRNDDDEIRNDDDEIRNDDDEIGNDDDEIRNDDDEIGNDDDEVRNDDNETVCVCVCVCVGLHQFGCEERRGAVAALEIFIAGGKDLRTAEDIPMCLHSCVCVCVCWASSIWG